MKGRVVIYVFILFLALVLVGSGCGSSEGEEAADTRTEEVVDMMKKVPKGCWSFMYMDLDAFRTDPDLEEIFVLLSGDGFKNWTDIIGIDLREVDVFAVAGRDFGDFSMLFKGDFNLGEVRENLEKLEQPDMDKGEYRGIEVWGEESGVALVSNELIIFGYAKACIDAMLDSDTSLYGDNNCRDVVERLPGGIIYEFQEEALRIRQFYSSYDGLAVSGSSMTKRDKNSMTITSICKFENVESAGKVIDIIKQDLVDYIYEDYRNIDVKQDAEFIKVITDVDIDGLFE